MRPILTAIAVGLQIADGGSLLAQQPVSSDSSLQVVADARPVATRDYLAKGPWRFLFGTGYRDLWMEPIALETLDLTSELGLEPVFEVGAGQTVGLAFRGADGTSYTFRGIEKEKTRGLPPDLRDSELAVVLQQTTVVSHPAARIVATQLPSSTVMPEPAERIVRLPDDPALGEFREKFAGMIGTFAVFPTPETPGHPGYMGATDLLSTSELWESYLSGGPRADANDYLRIRLFDIMIGDWDRHEGQWRWARLPGRTQLAPLAEDRDHAFAEYGGAIRAGASLLLPKMARFGPEIDGLAGLTANGAPLDRLVLAGLDRAAFQRAAREVISRHTDEAIDHAVRQMPPEYFELNGEWLGRSLRSRRDQLEATAEAFYRSLARQVDIHATDNADHVRVTHRHDGSVSVTIAPAASPDSIFYNRLFVPSETRELRIYLHRGSDTTEIHGAARIRVFVVAGPGGGQVFADGSGSAEIIDGFRRTEITSRHSIKVDRRPYRNPAPDPDLPWMEPRNWGGSWQPATLFGYNSNVGLFLGGGVRRTVYGFRKYPYAQQHRLRLAFAFGRDRARVDYVGTFRRSNSGNAFRIAFLASGLEHLNYYGLGNETDLVPDDVARADQQELRLKPGYWVELSGDARVGAAAAIRYFGAVPDDSTIVGRERPYGSSQFGMVGATAALEIDTRASRPFDITGDSWKRQRVGATPVWTGVHATVRTDAYPALWDAERPFGSIEGRLSAWAAPLETVTAKGFVGSRVVWGRYPWHQAAFLGGWSTLRGYSVNRFAGDASIYGGLEVRLRVLQTTLFVPGWLGLLGLADVGRVFLEGEQSDKWHPAWGGGLFFVVTSLNFLMFAQVAISTEETRVYLGSGFGN